MGGRSIEKRREALLARCRFYNGEAACPSGVFFLGWEVEEFWVRCLLRGDTAPLDAAVSSFRRIVPYEPCFRDGTPIAVQALLFNRYCYGADADPLQLGLSFSRFYVRKWGRV